jgi:hypothetical protein
MKAKVNRTNISEHLVEYQLKMIGKTMLDVEGDEMWYFNNTMTQEQHEEFKRYAIPLLKKIFKFNKGRAESTFGWFNLQFGLRIKQEEL